MNNHLARGDADLRTIQASMLVDWARDETLPIIAVGDYNMVVAFETERGNDAFAAILGDGIYKWIRPKEFIDTNWSDCNGDGVDDYPDSMLDFTFVAGQRWTGIRRRARLFRERDEGLQILCAAATQLSTTSSHPSGGPRQSTCTTHSLEGSCCY